MMHPNASLIGFGLFLMLFWFTSAGSVVFGLIMSVSNGWIGLVQGLVIRLAGG